MTDPRTPDAGGTAADRSDELASAYLDGEASEAERALVEADDELLARVARFEATRAAVRDVTPMAAEERDDLLAGVLRRLDQPVAPVVPVRRRPRGVDPSRWVAVAAAVVMVGLLGGAVAMLGSDGDSDASSTGDAATAFADDDAGGADDATAESAPLADHGEASDGEGAATRSSQHYAAMTDLGVFESVAALEAATREAISAPPIAPTDDDAVAGGEADDQADEDDANEDEANEGSDDVDAFDASICPPVPGVRLRATLVDRPVLVDVPDDAGANIEVRDAESCNLVTSFGR